MNSEQSPKPATPSTETQSVPIPTFTVWLGENWGWAAVLGAGLLLLGASIFFLVSVVSLPETGETIAPKGTLTPSAGGPTSVPVDLQSAPTNTAGPTDTPAPAVSDNGYEMVLVPAGTTRVGTTDDELGRLYALCNPILGEQGCRSLGFEEETPAHDVTLDAYYIDLYEITNQQYAQFLNEMGNQSGGNVQWFEAGDEKARIQFNAGQWQPIGSYAEHPATEVTWHGAQAFCEWRSGRLPTEAEWEKAARWDPATNTVNVYPWGPAQPNSEQANYALTGNDTRPVGSFAAGTSPLGLYDVAGNVFEWVSDWYAPGGYGSAEALNDPSGPESGTAKIIKGGSWGDNAFFLRGANRGTLPPTTALNFVGFRCVKEPGAVIPLP